MTTQYLLAILGVVLATLYIWVKNGRRKNKLPLPPGPTPWPLIGNTLQIGPRPYLRFSQWAKEYGPFFRVKVGLLDVIVVNDAKLMKELFNHSSTVGRMTENGVICEFTKGPHGIINAEGETWVAQRRFTLKTLRDFGFAKTSMEGLIMEEVSAMLEWFQTMEGKAISGLRIFNAPVVNSLWRIVAGEKWEAEKEEGKDGQCHRSEMLTAADEFFSGLVGISSVSGFLFPPPLRFVAPERVGWTRYVKSVENLTKIINRTINRHKETFNPNNLRDLMDRHILEMEETTDPQSSFYKESGHLNMVAGLFDLFLGGSETTSNTLSWILLYLSEFKEIQKKLQTEIDQVLGSSSRPVSLSDRSSMPFTESVLSEILRIYPVIPLGIPHRVINDIEFHGYQLKKGMAIFGNIYGIHHDSNTWENPSEFRPERFLNEDGTKFTRQEAFVPFSEGKRKCIGETLARDTLFLFVASIFQKFTIQQDPEMIGKFDREPGRGYFFVPKPFKVVLVERKTNQ